MFNKEMRKKALEGGYTLNEYSLRKISATGKINALSISDQFISYLYQYFIRFKVFLVMLWKCIPKRISSNTLAWLIANQKNEICDEIEIRIILVFSIHFIVYKCFY